MLLARNSFFFENGMFWFSCKRRSMCVCVPVGVCTRACWCIGLRNLSQLTLLATPSPLSFSPSLSLPVNGNNSHRVDETSHHLHLANAITGFCLQQKLLLLVLMLWWMLSRTRAPPRRPPPPGCELRQTSRLLPPRSPRSFDQGLPSVGYRSIASTHPSLAYTPHNIM